MASCGVMSLETESDLFDISTSFFGASISTLQLFFLLGVESLYSVYSNTAGKSVPLGRLMKLI